MPAEWPLWKQRQRASVAHDDALAARIRAAEQEGHTMHFTPGEIDGIIWRPLKKFHDSRGWLC